MDPNSFSKKMGTFGGPKDMLAPLLGFLGGMTGLAPLDLPVHSNTPPRS